MKKGNLLSMLKLRYPGENWDEEVFRGKGHRKASQRWLLVLLQSLFPNEEILENYFHDEIRMPSSGQPLQLDVYLQNSNLAFEYQGPQHYEQLNVFGDASELMARDHEKKSLCVSSITFAFIFMRKSN